MNMQQLPLEVRLSDHAVFESFYAGSNAAAVHALQQAATINRPTVIWIWGSEGLGKSHLLQACASKAHSKGYSTSYLPMDRSVGLLPEVVEGMGDLDLICVDDVHSVIGDAQWETALFGLFEGLKVNGARLVISANTAPNQTAISLPDLASRLASGATYRMTALVDQELLESLQHRATWLGMTLPVEVASFLLSRVARQTGSLFTLLAQLDKAALAAQRRLTVPFVKSVLGV